MTSTDGDTNPAWPALIVEDWANTRDTLQMWLQIVGKIRLVKSPLINHWWNVTLYVSPRGLVTSGIPNGTGMFDIEFDFVEHRLVIRSSSGATRHVDLSAKTVAQFHSEVMDALDALDVPVSIQDIPNEVDPAIPFAENDQHRSYDPAAANAFWRQLLAVDRVMHRFRASYLGKASPVHFFWGAMDLACTRFSGRTAPQHPGGAPNTGDWVMHEAYSHELSSAGFWPGGATEGAFYSYAYPEPDGYSECPVRPSDAFYSTTEREFILPYEAVRTSSDPDGALLDFLESTYAAAANRGDWNRADLELDPGRWDHKRTGA